MRSYIHPVSGVGEFGSLRADTGHCSYDGLASLMSLPVSHYEHAVSLSGCAQIGLSADQIEQELVRLTNRAMRRLYELGCRRMRTIKLPRTGDPIRYVVQGSRGWRW